MDYRPKQYLTVAFLLGVAVLMGVLAGHFQKGVTGGAIVGGVACLETTDCNDRVACTIDSCKNPGTDNSFCSNAPIEYCLNDDGCCPRGCVNGNDNDCR